MDDTIIMTTALATITNDNNVANSITTVLSTPELLHHILQNLAGINSLHDIPSLCLVSKQFQHTVTSNTIWRKLCSERWKSKWGFTKRWNAALYQYERLQLKNTSLDTYWMHKYQLQEMDSKRRYIKSAELKALVFDFRFWIGHPTVVDGRIIVQSGLHESASDTIRFHARSEDETNQWWSAQGVIKGHPLRTDDEIEWFLDEASGVIQWGFVPNLWPPGKIQRLENWGWEICNCNVVMRAMDSESQGKDADDSNANKSDHHLWNDLLTSLENVPVRNNAVNGFMVTAEVPRGYLDQLSL